LTSELCQIVGDGLFFTWSMFLEVVKTQDLTSKIWQALRDAIKQSIFNTFANFTWQLFFLSCTFA
jgi:hypothetical protein